MVCLGGRCSLFVAVWSVCAFCWCVRSGAATYTSVRHCPTTTFHLTPLASPTTSPHLPTSASPTTPPNGWRFPFSPLFTSSIAPQNLPEFCYHTHYLRTTYPVVAFDNLAFFPSLRPPPQLAFPLTPVPRLFRLPATHPTASLYSRTLYLYHLHHHYTALSARPPPSSPPAYTSALPTLPSLTGCLVPSSAHPPLLHPFPYLHMIFYLLQVFPWMVVRVVVVVWTGQFDV